MSDSDYLLFIYFSKSEVLLLLVYVDDIILIGSSESLLSRFVSTPSTSFAMKDLDEIHYFLGMEVTKSISGNNLLLTHRKYNFEILEKTTMLDCKPSATPIFSGTRVSLHAGEPLQNPSEYKAIVGASKYLTLTRPDITFAVNYTSQFLHASTSEHMLLVKRILRYLKSSLGSCITISPGDITTISGYSDSDWAGCTLTLEDQLIDIMSLLVQHWCLGSLRSNLLSPSLPQKLNTKHYPVWPMKLCVLLHYLKN
ncbi:uncharacterized protein LOC113324822 [Papaver somniferum]|uniref:uncharacterized protein LOC113324822 n=1 Tax=Papaver somniferum TaxID=3469 RepID=UPI000E6FAAEF|nr:uncharacterized protein LOC113324822 [Papaver somniferum]